VVRSDYVDLVAIVHANGGVVSMPFAGSKMWPLICLNNFCLDLHPEIDGYMKYLSAVDRETEIDTDDSSRAVFTDEYHLCWSVMEYTCVVSTGGDVLKGPDGILPNRDILPEGVELV